MSGSTVAKTQEQRKAGKTNSRSGEQSPRPVMSGAYADILKLQQSAGNQALHGLVEGGIPPVVQSVINSGGQPLEAGLRTQMESRFGQDFSQVRIHTDGRAADSAGAVSAKAYTVGQDVVFGQGRFAPDTSEGKRLLAHELAHVVQQSRGGDTPPLDSASSFEQGANAAADSGTICNGPVPILGASGVGVARDEDDKLPWWKKKLNPLYQKALDVLPKPAAEKLEQANEAARRLKEKLGVTDEELNVMTQKAEPLIKSAEHVLDVASLPPAPITRGQQTAEGKSGSQGRTTPPSTSHPLDQAQDDKKREQEFWDGIKRAHQTGQIYWDPTLDRPANEYNLREGHARAKALFPELVTALEKDPGYWRAMGIYKEDSNFNPQPGVPPPTRGISPPIKLFSLGPGPGMTVGDPNYWQTPRGQARASLSQDIKVTRAALESLFGERKDIVDSSIVIRKTAESMVGIKPPPLTKLYECSDLLRKSEQALENDDVEQAAKLYSDATRIYREASWYWSRYKEFLELGGERTVESLEMVRDTSKYSLMVLSMGGGGVVGAVGIAGGIAIDVTDTATQAALGQPVDWTKVTIDAAVNIALARFGGPLTKGIVGRLAKNPAFADIEKSLLTQAVVSVVNGMEARMVHTAVGSLYQSETWEQFVNQLSTSVTDPKSILLDLFLGAVHAKMKARSATGTEDKSQQPPQSVIPGKSSTTPNQLSPAGPANDNAVFPKVPQSFVGGTPANDVLPPNVSPLKRPQAAAPPAQVAAGQDFSASRTPNQPNVGAPAQKGDQVVASANQGRAGRQPALGAQPQNVATAGSRNIPGKAAVGQATVAPGSGASNIPFGEPEPTLNNSRWASPPITGNPRADRFEQSQRQQGKRSLYVFTGRNTSTGTAEHVEFDDYRRNDGMLIDAKSRTSGRGSIYDVRESEKPDKPGFRREIIRAKVMKQEEARQIAGAKGVVWIVQDPDVASALRDFFTKEGFTTFHVEGPR